MAPRRSSNSAILLLIFLLAACRRHDSSFVLVADAEKSCDEIWKQAATQELRELLNIDELIPANVLKPPAETISKDGHVWNVEAVIKNVDVGENLIHAKVTFEKPPNWDAKAIFVMAFGEPSNTPTDLRRGSFEVLLHHEDNRLNCLPESETEEIQHAVEEEMCVAQNPQDSKLTSETVAIIRPTETDFDGVNGVHVLWRVKNFEQFDLGNSGQHGVNLIFRTVVIFKKHDSTPHSYPIWILDSDGLPIADLKRYHERSQDCQIIHELTKQKSTVEEVVLTVEGSPGEEPTQPVTGRPGEPGPRPGPEPEPGPPLPDQKGKPTNKPRKPKPPRHIPKAEQGKTSLIKLHGSLMIVAFMVLSPVSIFIARYFKETWTRELLLGRGVWWWVHTTLHLAVLVLITIPITLYVQGFGFPISDHSITGLVTIVVYTVLCCTGWVRFNSRIMWNNLLAIAHTGGGWAVEIMALSVIMFSGELTSGTMPCYTSVIVILYVITRFVLYVVVGCHFKWLLQVLKVKNSEKGLNPCPLRVERRGEENVPGKKTRIGLLCTFTFCTCFWATILIVTMNLQEQYSDCDFATHALDD